MHLKKSLIILTTILSLSLLVHATGEISQDADRLNYDTVTLSHTVTVWNSGSEGVGINITCPADISFSSGDSCSSVSTLITCNIAPSGTASYTVLDSNSSIGEYTLSTCYVSDVNNSFTSQNNVSFIRIKNQEIFHTLVEYGRGRGNYFFDTFSSGVAGSGKNRSGL